MELVPLNRIKSLSTLVPPKATRGATFLNGTFRKEHPVEYMVIFTTITAKARSRLVERARTEAGLGLLGFSLRPQFSTRLLEVEAAFRYLSNLGLKRSAKNYNGLHFALSPRAGPIPPYQHQHQHLLARLFL